MNEKYVKPRGNFIDIYTNVQTLQGNHMQFCISAFSFDFDINITHSSTKKDHENSETLALLILQEN